MHSALRFIVKCSTSKRACRIDSQYRCVSRDGNCCENKKDSSENDTSLFYAAEHSFVKIWSPSHRTKEPERNGRYFCFPIYSLSPVSKGGAELSENRRREYILFEIFEIKIHIILTSNLILFLKNFQRERFLYNFNWWKLYRHLIRRNNNIRNIL